MKKEKEILNKNLSPEQYHVLVERGTERPFTGKLLYNKKKGSYRCARCGNVIFDSKTKFDSSCGWPSFYDAKKGSVKFKKDFRDLMIRTEVVCAKCGGHLGHLFKDAPQTPTGNRFCINSIALNFKPEKKKQAKRKPLKVPKPTKARSRAKQKEKTETAFFAAGCFWNVEEAFRTMRGVKETIVGYMGGDEKKYPNPSYWQVSTGKTGYEETTEIIFDPKKISYEKLLKKFWKIHDPTQINRQGPDVGKEYKSMIFYATPKQKLLATASKKEAQKKFKGKIATEIRKAEKFYRAEDYHQKYLMKRGLKTCRF